MLSSIDMLIKKNNFIPTNGDYILKKGSCTFTLKRETCLTARYTVMEYSINTIDNYFSGIVYTSNFENFKGTLKRLLRKFNYFVSNNNIKSETIQSEIKRSILDLSFKKSENNSFTFVVSKELSYHLHLTDDFFGLKLIKETKENRIVLLEQNLLENSDQEEFNRIFDFLSKVIQHNSYKDQTVPFVS